MRRLASGIAFALLAMAVLGFAVFAVGVLTGHFVAEDQTQPAGPATVRTQPPPPAPKAPPVNKPAARKRPAAGAPQLLTVRIVASRGDCWVSARRGSQTGSVLADRVLASGNTLSLRARRIWLELGAAGNVDVSVNGKPRAIPTGTTQIVLN